jgi:ornithine cyclodeaminase|uniref:Ornithine cyclodeaminase n=1 Tax=Phaeodactylum tricornutum TaxID=2850 RepID=A0A8J9TG47_PHATR
MLMLSESDVKRVLTMKDCLQVNRLAFQAVAADTAQVPTRLGLAYADPGVSNSSSSEAAQDWTLFKPAAYQTKERDHMGLKVVSIRSNNGKRGLPLVPASILSLHPSTGMVQAVVAGTYLTAMRTATGSALSAQLLRPDAAHIVVFGAGLQAEFHVQALATALEKSLPLVTLINRTRSRAEALQSTLEATDWVDHVHVVDLSDRLKVAETLATADVVVTATNTATPLFDGSLLRPGTHIAGVGSYTPDMQEISARTVDRCKVLIDTPEARTVGDLKNVSMSHPVALLGDLLQCQDENRENEWMNKNSSPFDCTFFKSVGTAIQDVLTADLVVQKSKEQNIGLEVDMS